VRRTITPAIGTNVDKYHSLPAFPVLETQRLILRAATPADAEAIKAIFADPEVTRYHDLSTFTTIEEALAVIERRAQRFSNGTGIRWGIARKEDNILIGSCGFGAWNKETRTVEIGYELLSAFWGQGIMTEALQAVLKFGFEQMGWQRIIARVMLDNTASIKLLQKLSFQDAGLLRQHGFWKGQHHDLRRFVLLRTDTALYSNRTD